MIFPLAFRRLLPLLLILAVVVGRTNADPRVPLRGDRTTAAASGQVVGSVASAAPLTLTLALAPRDPQGLRDLLRRLYDPADPLYRRFLTPGEFTDRFGPTLRQYARVAAFARAQGLTVTGGSPNRLLLHVQAPTSAVEAAFGVRLRRFQGAHGRLFHAPDSAPTVPASLAPLLVGIIGLDDSALWRPHVQPRMAEPDAAALVDPFQAATGPSGGLSPTAIRTAYGLGGLPASADGSGQTLAVFELDGYNPSDIAAYENYFGLPPVPLTDVPVDNGPGTLGAGQAEVTLDIELQIAVAPGISSLLVYEGPNSGQGLLDTYNQIALDDKAQQISTSWGISEGQAGAAFLSAESTIFQELAAQGQTLYAASGDGGAHDNGSTLSVDDPASQPYVTGAGGTSLSLGAADAYGGETAWASGGGGVSAFWPIPYWQQAAVGAAAPMRNVPDVSLDADPYTGYAICLNGGWPVYGGTSCAAPIWAAFTALVNQQRAVNGVAPLGFANPILYAIGAGQYGSYAADFHDITSGNNGYYFAASGYDDATGLGSFNGANLLTDLAAAPPALSAKPTGLIATPGNYQVSLSWNAVPGAAFYNVYRATTSGGEESAAPIKTETTATAYTDTSVSGGTRYYYVVTAANFSGESGPSSEADATPFGPTVTVAAAASPAPVTGTSAALSVQAQDAPGQALTYAWSATGTPPAPVSFSPSSPSATPATTATFTASGTDTLTVTVTDSRGLTATSAVTVTVQQTPTSLSVSPASAALAPGATQQFTASVKDQFGAALTAAPTWAVSGGGTASSAGLFTASGASGGPYTLTAAQGAASGTAAVTVTSPPVTSTIRYAPRPGFEGRMVGGQFQGSSDGVTYTTLYTVGSAPPAGQWTSATLALDLTQYRYLRYLSPDGCYGNVADIEFDSGGVKLTGTGFGTAGSWSNDGNVFGNALDGDLGTFFDAPAPGNGDFVGIDRGAGTGAGGTAPVTGTIRYAPRPGFEGRMVGGQFQGSTDGTTYVTLYTVGSAPPAGQWTSATLALDLTQYRYLRYLSPDGCYGNVADIEFDSGGVKLTGTGFGTAGSWSNDGNVFGNALDGDLGTFFNAPAPGNGDFVGIDRGAGAGAGASPAPAVTSTIRYAPRPGFEGRMVGGQFQGSTDGTTYVTLYTVGSAPPAGQWTSATLALDLTQYRYLRYLSPDGCYGNVADIEFDSGGVKLTGTGFGTAGSWSNDGNVFGNALDGDLGTFFDAPAPGNGDFVGIQRY